MRSRALNNILNHDIPNINQKLKNINDRGCGLFAYVLHKSLKSRGISSKIVLLSLYRGVYNTFKEVNTDACMHELQVYKKDTREKNYPPFLKEFRHIAIRIKDRVFDSTGEITGEMTGKYRIIGRIQSIVLLRMVQSKHIWNDEFRSSNKNVHLTPIINNFIGKELNKLRKAQK